MNSSLVTEIKGPQLLGIVLGCTVFTLTLVVVLYLLIKSGTLGRALAELQSPQNDLVAKKEQSVSLSMYSSQPLLYDNLLDARKTLSTELTVPVLQGNRTMIRSIDFGKDLDELLMASDGRALFNESSYDPLLRLFAWEELDEEDHTTTTIALDSFTVLSPSRNTESIQRYLQHSDRQQVVIVDTDFQRLIGVISLAHNRPRDLSIAIDYMWLTPAFQGNKRAHEAMLLLITHLFDLGYRRITCALDERHIIARKFLQRCGFYHEATLRKHRIVRRRNCNAALYVLLNSDWADTLPILSKLCQNM